MSESKTRLILIRVLYYLIGVLMLVGALVKGMNLYGFSQHLARFDWVPLTFTYPLSWVLFLLEALLGSMLVGLYGLKAARRILIGLLGIFLLVFLVLMFKGYRQECGCYGPLIHISPLGTVIKNAVLILVLFFLDGRETPAHKGRGPVGAWVFGLVLTGVMGLSLLGAQTSLFDPLLVKLRPGFEMSSLPSLDPAAVNKGKRRLVFIQEDGQPPNAAAYQKAFPGFELVVLRVAGETKDPQPQAGITVLPVKESIIHYYYHQLPTVFTIEDGVVDQVWYGRPPTLN